MTEARSAVFAALALLWSVATSLLYVPLLLIPRRQFQRAAALWCRGLIVLLRLCCGLDWRLEGREHLPAGPAIFAVKHQSAWDTLVWHLLLPDPVYILKRELLGIPFLGWYLRKAGNIAIDRAAGVRAIRSMLPAANKALAEGSQIIVFPEGTRAEPGVRRPYQPGVAALYARADVPLVPVALNSGLFWGRQHFRKRPGVITLQILPSIPPGLPRAAFLAELERRIETATDSLCTGAVDEGGRTPS